MSNTYNTLTMSERRELNRKAITNVVVFILAKMLISAGISYWARKARQAS